MNHRNLRDLMVLPVLLLAMATTSVVQAEAPATAPEGAIAAVATFQQSLAAGKREGILAVLAPDVLIYESGGVELSREAYMSHHMVSDMAFVAATKHAIIDQVSGMDGNTAWVLTRSTTKGAYKEHTIDLVGTETMLLRKSGDGWQIFHIHWSSRSGKSKH